VRGSSGRSCGLGICCDLTCAAVGRVAWRYLKTRLPSLKHSQKRLATGASSWVADHRKQLAATNLASPAQMTLSKGTCHLHQLWEVHSGGEQEEGWCWRYAQSFVLQWASPVLNPGPCGEHPCYELVLPLNVWKKAGQQCSLSVFSQHCTSVGPSSVGKWWLCPTPFLSPGASQVPRAFLHHEEVLKLQSVVRVPFYPDGCHTVCG